MISFLGYPSNAGSAESVLLFWRPVTPKAIAVNPRYLPERISGAVAQSRLYHRRANGIRQFAFLGCAWNQWTKPSAQSKRRKMSLFLIQPWTFQFDPESFRG